MFDSTGCNFMPQSSDRDILCILISNHPRQVAKYLYLSFSRRQSMIFKK